MSRLPLAALGCFVLGVALMIPFEHPVTRVLGVAALLTAIVAGAFAIASPELLERDDREDLPRDTG